MTRFEEITLQPKTARSLLSAAVAAFDLGTCVQIDHQPQGVGDVLTETCRITGIKHRLADGGLELETTWRLTKSDPTSYFTVNDPVLGLTDTTNRVAP